MGSTVELSSHSARWGTSVQSGGLLSLPVGDWELTEAAARSAFQIEQVFDDR
jgi:hypothetical protein